jgi:uncharacterized membrane protein
MKNLILIAVFLVTAWAGQAVYAQQGFGTNAPDKSAAVDIVSTKRGFLMQMTSQQQLFQQVMVLLLLLLTTLTVVLIIK